MNIICNIIRTVLRAFLRTSFPIDHTHTTRAIYESAHIHVPIYVAKVLCVHKDICVVVLMLRNSLYVLFVYGENVSVSCNICFDNTLIVFGIIFERLMRGKAFVYVEYFCVYSLPSICVGLHKYAKW